MFTKFPNNSLRADIDSGQRAHYEACGLHQPILYSLRLSLFFLPISHVCQFLNLYAFAPAQDMLEKHGHKPLCWHGF